MNGVQGWLSRFPGTRWTPLFATNDALEVQTHLRGLALDRRLPTRAPGYDFTVTELIEPGLQHPSWTGLLYLMARETPRISGRCTSARPSGVASVTR